MHAVVSAIYAVQRRRAEAEPERLYLGGSAIGGGLIFGGPCTRQLWYRFRAALDEVHEERMLRLFETGHREETRVIEELKAAGFDVLDRAPDGRQWEVSAFGGHFQGHFDGLILLEGSWHLLEIKTSATADWKAVHKHGMRAKKPGHYAQVQTYLALAQAAWSSWGIDGEPPAAALYVMVAKETDHIHAEVVEIDLEEAGACYDRAQEVIAAVEPPARIRESALSAVCAQCTFHEICHDAYVPRVDCRTCLSSTPDVEAGGWTCQRFGAIPPEHLRNACDEHVFISPLVEPLLGAVVDYDQHPFDPISWVEYHDGDQVTINAAASSQKRGLSSAEIARLPNTKLPKC